MQFQSLEIRNFRNIKEVDLNFGPHLNLFFGHNGQGKTNLLEAIFLLCRSRSFRPADKKDLLPRGKEFDQDSITCHLAARVLRQNLDYSLQWALSPTQRRYRLNGKSITMHKVMETLPLVLFSPESLMAIKSGPNERRRLLDEMLLLHSPQSAEVLQRFDKVLRHRNRLLKDYKKEKVASITFRDTIASLNPQFLNLGTRLTVYRLRALTEIQPLLSAIYGEITGVDVDIHVDYLISSQPVPNEAHESIHQLLKNRLGELQKAEILSGTSLLGPQRHEIVFRYNGEDSRFYCSQGQQRAIILAFKIAQIVYHEKIHNDFPILLLDDVMSELDEKKRDSLISYLKKFPAQTFLTTTDFDCTQSFAGSSLSVFEIEKGNIRSTI